MSVLNELRRPALMLECDLFFFAFVEQASEARCWKVTTVDKAMHFETFYRQPGQRASERLSVGPLLLDHGPCKVQFEGFRRRSDAKVFFCELSSKADYRSFLRRVQVRQVSEE